jgi:hypothetical protein
MVHGNGSRAQGAPGFVAEAVPICSGEVSNSHTVAPMRVSAHLVRVPEAARITGLPPSLLRKSFMSEDKRPKNVPPPPPHKRIGRAVYIVANELPAWIESLGEPSVRRRRGRPTVADRIMRRRHEVV